MPGWNAPQGQYQGPPQQPNAYNRGAATPQQYGTRPPQGKRRRRVFPWLFLAIQLLFLVWIVVGIAGSGGADNTGCEGLTGQALRDCQEAGDTGAEIGTTIGVGLIIGLWAATDLILGISYLMFRLLRRSA